VVLIETCCGNNIGRGGEELLRWRTHNCLVTYTHATGIINGNHNAWFPR
jgi:hypothetical protein